MKKTTYVYSIIFACALVFLSCAQKTPEMTLEEINAEINAVREARRQTV